MKNEKACPKPGEDEHNKKASEHSRKGGDDAKLKDKERSGPSREHNG